MLGFLPEGIYDLILELVEENKKGDCTPFTKQPSVAEGSGADGVNTDYDPVFKASYHTGGTNDYDPVSKPSHYADGPIECIDAMRIIFGDEKVAAFCQLNSFKYLWRAGKKGDADEDIAKAKKYHDFLRKIGNTDTLPDSAKEYIDLNWDDTVRRRW